MIDRGAVILGFAVFLTVAAATNPKSISAYEAIMIGLTSILSICAIFALSGWVPAEKTRAQKSAIKTLIDYKNSLEYFLHECTENKDKVDNSIKYSRWLVGNRGQLEAIGRPFEDVKNLLLRIKEELKPFRLSQMLRVDLFPFGKKTSLQYSSFTFDQLSEIFRFDDQFDHFFEVRNHIIQHEVAVDFENDYSIEDAIKTAEKISAGIAYIRLKLDIADRLVEDLLSEIHDLK